MQLKFTLPLIFWQSLQLPFTAQAWSTNLFSHTSQHPPKAQHTFSPSSLHAVSSDASIETLDGTKGIDDSTIVKAAQFMMKSFWGVTEDNPGLLSEQASDLEGRHGEILGKRKLFSKLITASSSSSDDDSMGYMGMVGVEVGLFDLKTKQILNYKESDQILTNAVASLGPKQRREFKNAKIEQLVAELPSLEGSYEAVAVLANLCVSPESRGMGLADKLCTAVEDVVSNEWGMEKIMLKVEAENIPAKSLYEKLGFVVDHVDEESIAIRPDLETNSFAEIPCQVLTLSKSL
jgi:ribosomal protein S18 acetylase RimI-like enzyme